MLSQCVTAGKNDTVLETIERLRSSNFEHDMISYVYVVGEPDRFLQGVVDLRELVLIFDALPLSEVMISPVVAAVILRCSREDLEELFAKYHYRMLPVARLGEITCWA